MLNLIGHSKKSRSRTNASDCDVCHGTFRKKRSGTSNAMRYGAMVSFVVTAMISAGSGEYVDGLVQDIPVVPHSSHVVEGGLRQVELGSLLQYDSITHRLEGDSEDEEHHSEDEEHHSEEKPWGKVILSAFLVNLVTLVGVLLFVPSILHKKKSEAIVDTRKLTFSKALDITLLSFGAGALLATSVFLIIPEALHLIPSTDHISDEHGSHDEDGHRFLSEDGDVHDEDLHPENESVIAAKFGCALLGGFFLPLATSLLIPKKHRSDDSCVVTDEEEGNKVLKEVDVDEVPQEVKKPIDYNLVASILVGDALHNLCDGVFIGVAFLLCEYSVAVSIVAVTVYHELAQEIADYVLLTKHANLNPLIALALNFISGLSVVFGGIIVLSTDVTKEAVGILLALAAGVYIHVAACESIPRLEDMMTSRKEKILSLLMIIIGTVPIGLVLLDHKHCD